MRTSAREATGYWYPGQRQTNPYPMLATANVTPSDQTDTYKTDRQSGSASNRDMRVQGRQEIMDSGRITQDRERRVLRSPNAQNDVITV